MLNIAIILSSLALLVLILYLADFKFEFKYHKKSIDNPTESNNSDLDILSNTELNILKLVSDGRSNQEIADELFISIHTVKKHVSNIFKKLNVRSRSEVRKYKDLIK
jgi:DNA-binding CsgD family transcriptional regulator